MTNILTSEVILQPSRTSMADHSCRNSLRLKFFSYFRRKAPPQMFFWALNMSLYLIWLTCQQTFFKVGNKDTETVSVSLMGTLNTVCLTYSFDDLLFKWYLYFTLDNSLFYSVFFDLTNKHNQKLINILENQKI